ncbi:MAG: hypothetical protein Q9228_001266 [Teloschistes exilis]
MSGFRNLELIEAGERLGGFVPSTIFFMIRRHEWLITTRRVHTAYLEGGPSDYQYQEMGPMRFPESIQYAGSNETIPINDMKLTFQLADVMNQLNAGQPNYTVNFIPWLQSSPNGLYYYSGFKKPNGLPPTATEVKNNPNLTIEIPADPIVGNITDQIAAVGCTPDKMAAAAKNTFMAYKTFVEAGLGGLGGDDWSEFAYLHNQLKYSLNLTDQAVNGGEEGGLGGNSLWDTMFVLSVISARSLNSRRADMSAHTLVQQNGAL